MKGSGAVWRSLHVDSGSDARVLQYTSHTLDVPVERVVHENGHAMI